MFSDFSVCDTIQKRHSVRTFDAKPLDGETLEKLTAYAKDLRNPFDVPVTVHVLETGIGANHFCLTAWEQGLAGSLKVMDAPTDADAPENYRYLFTWTEEQA